MISFIDNEETQSIFQLFSYSTAILRLFLEGKGMATDTGRCSFHRHLLNLRLYIRQAKLGPF